ncbi:MAG: hypothetical protein EBU08_22315, partial [Micrococcales bacterium]|nr:hypothetical protein [Micrococcales bacterium]
TVGNLVASNSANVTSITATEYVYGQFIRSTNRSGDEGGELQLANAVTNTTLSTGVTVDVFQNKFRIFETGGTSRGGYFDISSLAAGAGTNLGAGSVTPPGGTATQVQFNNGGSSFGGATSLLYQANGQVIANASITSTSASTGVLIVPNGGIGVSGNVYCGQVYSTNNGNGTNYAVGDDVWLGDINLANTMVLKGQQDGSQGYLIFGNGTQLSLGRSGSGPLTYQGAFTANGGLQNTPIGNSTASTGSFTSVTASGQITVNSGNNATAIVNGGTSGTGNIGASGATFNTIFAKATTAQYADLAENYIADAEYAPGTVVIFGGEQEITTTTESHDTRVAGIISTNPAYLMNSGCDGLPVALQGRVPCQVKGPVCKGDLLVT